jgi:hypothetical protein
MMTILALLLAALGQDPVDPQHVVAVVLERKITAGEVGLKSTSDLGAPPAGTCAPDHPVSKLQTLVWRETVRHYVDAKGLKATPEDLREIRDFTKKSEEDLRKRRTQELQDVEKRLASVGVPEEERKNLENRLTVLRSLADNDRWQADHPEEARKSIERVYTPWVEASKMDDSLYREFGGVVAITKFGQVPTGARAALLRRQAKEGKLTFADAALEKLFWTEVEARPRLVAAPDKVDLRPFWKIDR